MTGTGQGSSGSTSAFRPEAGPDLEPSRDLDAGAQESPAVEDQVIEMMDGIERLFDDPARAWEAVETEIARRRDRPREWGPSKDKDRENVERGDPGRSTGGAMSSNFNSTTLPGRPFVGFDRERATYHRHKPDLLKTAEGQWVVIVGEDLVGPLESEGEAVRVGFKRFGLGPIYVRQVLAQEPPPVLLPFGLVPCPT